MTQTPLISGSAAQSDQARRWQITGDQALHRHSRSDHSRSLEGPDGMRAELNSAQPELAEQPRPAQ